MNSINKKIQKLEQEKKIIETKPGIIPIAIHQHINQNFTKQEIVIDSGDTFYLFTDGFIDQFGGNKDKRFNKNRFKKLLLEIHKKPMKEQERILDKTIEEWKGKGEQIDDMLILGFLYK